MVSKGEKHVLCPKFSEFAAAAVHLRRKSKKSTKNEEKRTEYAGEVAESSSAMRETICGNRDNALSGDNDNDN
jgi:hypothetical protein